MGIKIENFVEKLTSHKVNFYAGVPDSLLKSLGNFLYENVSDNNHIIAANEGNALALAAGAYIATGNVPVVYLQNSGLGNLVNPLLSMADKSLYAIPVIILVGWRGQPGFKDAEQHLRQGPTTQAIIDTMGYPQAVLSKDEHTALAQIDSATDMLSKDPQPYFFVVEDETFESYPLSKKPKPAGELGREEALRVIAEKLPTDYFVVTTTGKTSREWFEVRAQLAQGHAKDFLTVGSMGHTSSIALGMALQSTANVLCIDGDGSMLMHLGAAVLAGRAACKNLKYIVINNFSHESVGGIPTPLEALDFEQFFRAVGFQKYFRADNKNALETCIEDFIHATHAVLEVRVAQGSRKDLARPDKSAGELAKILRQEFDKRA